MLRQSDTMWETISPEEEQPEETPRRGLLSSEHCGCGCGRPAIEGAQMHAVLLAAARQSLRKLEAKAKSGGQRTRDARRLLWAWKRCEEGFEAFVHGEPIWEMGPPTPLWVNSWRDRVERL